MGDLGSVPGLARSPGEGKGYPLQCSGLENSMDSPWGHKESDTTERISLHFTSCFKLDSMSLQLVVSFAQIVNPLFFQGVQISFSSE